MLERSWRWQIIIIIWYSSANGARVFGRLADRLVNSLPYALLNGSIVTPQEQPRKKGRFVSVLGIEAPARTLAYQQAYNKLWKERVFADPEALKHLRERRTKNTIAWRRRKRDSERTGNRRQTAPLHIGPRLRSFISLRTVSGETVDTCRES